MHPYPTWHTAHGHVQVTAASTQWRPGTWDGQHAIGSIQQHGPVPGRKPSLLGSLIPGAIRGTGLDCNHYQEGGTWPRSMTKRSCCSSAAFKTRLPTLITWTLSPWPHCTMFAPKFWIKSNILQNPKMPSFCPPQGAVFHSRFPSPLPGSETSEPTLNRKQWWAAGLHDGMALQSPYLEPQLSTVTNDCHAAGCSWMQLEARQTHLAGGSRTQLWSTANLEVIYPQCLGLTHEKLFLQPHSMPPENGCLRSMNMWFVADYCRVLEASHETIENAPDMHRSGSPHCWPAIWLEGEAHSILGTPFRWLTI